MKCYSIQTQRYFDEVLQSHENKCYRSAVVMLYSTVICDILYKLKELHEIYGDSVANKILTDIDSSRIESSGMEKSAWEWKLIERVHQETNLIDDASFADIEYLKKQRNLCAHPALNPDYELFQPNAETVLAHIRNMYDGLFVKPPVFIKSVIDHLTNDISSKKATFELDPDLYQRYLKNMYFEKMSEAMFKKVFKAIWKFVFISTEPICAEHRGINMLLLVYMIKHNKLAISAEFQVNAAFYQNITEEEQKIRLLTFIIKCPEIVDFLPEILKQQAVALKSVINQDTLNIYALTWFAHENLSNYADELITQINKYPHLSIHVNVLSHIKKLCVSKITPEVYCRIACAYCSKCRSFDTADKRIAEAILPALDVFSEESFKNLLEVFGSNNQIHGRSKSIQDDRIIANRILELNPCFDFAPYKTFNVAQEDE